MKVVVIGAGIAGVSTAIWLRRGGHEVTLLDRSAPGQGTSYGNAGLLAASSVAPVTGPGLIGKAPGMLFNPEYPLFMRWAHFPRLIPWLIRYLSHANADDGHRIARGLAHITLDTIEQHKALAGGTPAEKWLHDCDYKFAYASRAAFEGDAIAWTLRREAGFVPQIIEGEAVRELEPSLGPSINCLALMKDHGFISDPGNYVADLAKVFENEGGTFVTATLEDFELIDGKIQAVLTDAGRFECDNAVLTTGVWSKPLMKKLGINVPLETERGYHIVFRKPSVQPTTPTMIAAGKFVATPMATGLRCAGVLEFGGIDNDKSDAPLKLLRKKVMEAFPTLTAGEEETWMGHRPAPADSLPLIGEVRQTGIYTAFGHHHIGLTGGPKSGRMVARMISGETDNVDPAPFDPNRFV